MDTMDLMDWMDGLAELGLGVPRGDVRAEATRLQRE